MKVLALVASPRKLGNCEIVAKQMLAAFPEDAEREMLRLTDLRIATCTACYQCLPATAECGLDDDLKFLLDKIKAADAVIIVSACYFLGAHTSIKTVGDRLLSVLANRADFQGKKCATVVVYGIPGWDGYARESVRNFARFLHLEVIGSLTVQAANPGEAARPEVLADVRELALALAEGVSAPTDCQATLVCPGCGSRLLVVGVSGSLQCVMCGSMGTLRQQADGFAAEFTQCEPRFSDAGIANHAARLEAVKQHYLATRMELYRRRKPYAAYDWEITPRQEGEEE